MTINAGTLFEGNYAKDGGAIYVANGKLTVNGGDFTGNWATNGEEATRGGAIYAADGTEISISGGTFGGNTTGRILEVSGDAAREVKAVWVADEKAKVNAAGLKYNPMMD